MSTEQMGRKKVQTIRINSNSFNTPSSNPDYTVGFGVSPNQHFMLADFTADREFHPALKTSSLFSYREQYIK